MAITLQACGVRSNAIIVASLALVGLCLLYISASRSQPGDSSTAAARTAAPDTISISMPDIRPDHGEQYLCIAHRLPASQGGQFLVGFNPAANADRVHHMLMFGCQKPGIYQRDSPNFVWDCSSMHAPMTSQDSSESANTMKSFEEAPVCQGRQQILYGWALDAPALKLPEKVGFMVGGHDTDIHFLVLQVHYGHYRPFQRLPDLTDNSGLVLDVKNNEPASGITRRAGVLILMSYGQVLMGKSMHEVWCDIDEDIELHPFRYRVHTHKLGTRVLGAHVTSRGSTYQDSTTTTTNAVTSNNNIIISNKRRVDLVIGDGDPQKPQMFYPVKEQNMVIRKGESIYARCEFNNNRSRIVNIGLTAEDEMCNFYLMYWTDNLERILRKDSCNSLNPSAISLLTSLLSS